MPRILWATTATLALTTGAALAQPVPSTAETLVAELQRAGYTRIEIEEGPKQTKVEAANAREKIEYVFDRASGAILSQEVEIPDADDLIPGIEIEREDEDFIAASGAVLDVEDDEEEDDDEDEEDDEDEDDDDEDDDDEDEDEDEDDEGEDEDEGDDEDGGDDDDEDEDGEDD